MRRKGTIRGRMVRMLAVPLTTMLCLLVLIVVNEAHTYRAARAASATVSLSLAVQDLVHELQKERGLTNGLLGGEARYRADVDQQRRRTDTARAALDTLTVDADADVGPGAAAARVALERLGNQSVVRGSVDTGNVDRLATFDYYTAAIDALNGLDTGVAETGDPALRGHLAALQALGDAKEASAQERGLLNGIFAAGRFSGSEYARFADLRGTRRQAIAEFDRHATDAQRARLQEALRSTPATLAAGFEQIALAAADGRSMTVSPRSWWDAMTSLVDDMRAVQQAVGADARSRAGDLQRRAAARLILLVALAALVVAVEVLVLLRSANSITRPLAELAREADDVATRRLPASVAQIQVASDEVPPPLPVRVPASAGAEIRQVADSLDRVQQVAHALAGEQAVLRRNTTESLASLGRRNQNLLRRQLGFITQLEREEADPSTLANLFELDHLATRMRRNAESLLVLVGDSTPRRSAAPLPLMDVIRSAIGEVEEYRRVDLRRIDDAHLNGSAVTGVAHVIAELVENGLSFSPPDINVEIYGRWVGPRYLIAIVDQGIGMSDADLARSNARLSGEESFLLGPARFLGHYVVGRLARDLGAAVQLAHSPINGVTARLVLPAELLVAASPERPEPVRAEPTWTVSLAEPALRAAATLPAGPALPVPDPGGNADVNWFQPVPSSTRVEASGPDRTENGLVRRRRKPRPAASGAPTTPPGATNGPRGPAVDRPPGEVRSMLTTFRAGMHRAEVAPAAPAHTTHITDDNERGQR
jgi:hypothetical protein